MGVVYRAFSSKLNRTVALKTLKRIDPIAVQRFKHEFRAIAQLNHPSLVTLYELISDGETWFFSMELVAGVGFLQYVRSAVGDDEADAGCPEPGRSLSPLQLIRLRRGLTQLVTAVASLHRAGLLHRDIKPSNIMVTAEERLVLLDFGLAAELGRDGAYLSIDANLVGTVPYMSPEQAFIQQVTQASDCYSVGVVLYEALTGRVPFSGSPLDLLLAKREQDPPPPRALVAGVPEDLNQLCVDLLQRKAEDRPTAEAILQRLTDAGTETWRGAVEAATTIEKTPLVGRDTHLATLRACYAEMEQGQPVLVFVHGNSGMGKSALLREFCDRIRRQGSAVVLSGRCYEQESVPFKALDSLIDSLCNYLRKLPRAEADVLMPRDIQALMRVFPVLGRVEAVYDVPRRSLGGLDQQELRRRAVSALRELLTRIGDRCPLMLVIDDLQWGDVDSAVMLCELLKPPDAPLLMLAGAYRAEDAQTSPFLQAFREAERRGLQRLNFRELAVGPLSEDEARQLAVLLLEAEGHSGEQAAMVAHESGGSPFFTKELARYFRASLGQTPGRVDLKSILASRLCDLPAQDLRLLQILAAAGRPMQDGELLEAAELEAHGASSLARLKGEHLIRVTSADGGLLVEPYHDRIREAVASQMDRDTLRRVHRRLADMIRATLVVSHEELIAAASGSAMQDKSCGEIKISPEDWQRIFELGFHYGAAGEYDQAWSFALLAGEQARSQHALEIAEEQYRIAERGVPEADEATRFRIAEGLGDVLMLRGRYQAADQVFKAASILARDSFTRAHIEGKLGELGFKQGDNKAGIEAAERSLRLQGRRIPKRMAGFLLFLVWEILVQTLHTLFPKIFLARRSLQGRDQELAAIELLDHLGRAYFFERGVVPCLWTHLRSINLAERYPPTRQLGLVWASHAPVMSLIPWISRGETYGKKSIEIREQLHDVCGRGQSHHYMGVLLFVGARYEECISNCREAVRLCERSGDFWERNMAWWQSANAVYRKGDLTLAVTEAKRLYEVCVEMGDNKVSGMCLDVWSRASGGRLPTDIVQREMQKERNDVQATVQVLLGEAMRLVGQNELTEAVKTLTRAGDTCRDAGIMNAWTSPILSWTVTALRLQLERLVDSTPLRRRLLLSKARRAARQALAVARRFPTDLPHALREAGLVAAMQGTIRKARRLLDESLAVADRQDARFEHAQTLLARGRIGLEFGWSGADDDLVTARQALRSLGADFALDEAGASKPEPAQTAT
jgi:eukaryotic-like serine/threonine-protein kinase